MFTSMHRAKVMYMKAINDSACTSAESKIVKYGGQALRLLIDGLYARYSKRGPYNIKSHITSSKSACRTSTKRTSGSWRRHAIGLLIQLQSQIVISWTIKFQNCFAVSTILPCPTIGTTAPYNDVTHELLSAPAAAFPAGAGMGACGLLLPPASAFLRSICRERHRLSSFSF